ncbi:hypothetical protein GGR54DRAFT_133764 [Hypoxylon sp. NC1633]|nr:hypothetical protein GGR54DRAFT_133764 [Hypoxylon sp. NC1633]
MAPTRPKDTKDIGIELLNPKQVFCPGDEITGHVVRTESSTTPNATVRICLVCRAQSAVKFPARLPGPSARNEHLPRNLQAELYSESKLIYQGSICYGDNAWKFGIVVPSTASGVYDSGQNPRILPPTFRCGTGFTKHIPKSFVFVEYVLEAEILHHGQPLKTVFPVNVRLAPKANPVMDLELQEEESTHSIKTMRLLRDHADSRSSFYQHMQTIFQPERIPKLTFHATVKYPSVILLDHPDRIPFEIRLVPEIGPAATTEDFLRNLPPITLVALDLRIMSATHNWAFNEEGTGIQDPMHQFKGAWRETPIVRPFMFPGPEGMALRRITDSHTDDTAFALDIGQQLDLHLTSCHASMEALPAQYPSKNIDKLVIRRSNLTKALEPPLYPSFVTDFVSNEHQLAWKVTLECGGKKTDVVGSAPVTLLGPSTEQRHQKFYAELFDAMADLPSIGYEFVAAIVQGAAGAGA